MDGSRDKTSLKGSQGNVAESSQPLLETLGSSGEGTNKGSPERERVEIESAVPKVSTSREMIENEGAESEKRRFRTLSLIDSFTMNLNLLDRDTIHINDYINVAFEEVLAEPRVNQSLDQIWKFAYLCFAGTKLWVYRALTAVLALPLGFLWGLIFSLLALTSVWILSPTLRIIDIVICIIRRVWGGLIHAILDPIFESAGLRNGKGEKKNNRQDSV